MWPIPEIRHDLPPHLLAEEEEDFVVLRCTRCGMVAPFSAYLANPQMLLDVARLHRCGEEGGEKDAR